MASPSHLKPLYSPHTFSMKSTSPSSSSLTSMKLKTLVHNFIFSHLYRLARTITKAKSLLIEILKDIQIHVHFIEPLKKKNKKKYKNKYKNKNKNKLFFGSFRLHYNWCSSHVVPIPSSPLQGLHHHANQHVYYDSTWNSMVSTTTKCDDDMPESQLTGYLHWLEEEGHKNPSIDEFNDEETDEIDKLADKFIANCHEKFRLEKIESYRKYQEMMARSV